MDECVHPFAEILLAADWIVDRESKESRVPIPQTSDRSVPVSTPPVKSLSTLPVSTVKLSTSGSSPLLSTSEEKKTRKPPPVAQTKKTRLAVQTKRDVLSRSSAGGLIVSETKTNRVPDLFKESTSASSIPRPGTRVNVDSKTGNVRPPPRKRARSSDEEEETHDTEDERFTEQVRDTLSEIKTSGTGPSTEQQQKKKQAKKQKKERGSVSGVKVKRPPNLYTFFINDKRPELVERLGLKNTTTSQDHFSIIGQELGKVWHETSEEEKEPYRIKAQVAYEHWLAQKNALGLISGTASSSSSTAEENVYTTRSNLSSGFSSQLASGLPPSSSSPRILPPPSPTDDRSIVVPTTLKDKTVKKKKSTHQRPSLFGIDVHHENVEKLIYKRFYRLFPLYYSRAGEHADHGEPPPYLTEFEKLTHDMQRRLNDLRRRHLSAVSSALSTAAAAPTTPPPVQKRSTGAVGVGAPLTSPSTLLLPKKGKKAVPPLHY